MVDGYWGDVTAAHDWCEANYDVTIYVAEFFNTLSSLCLVLVGLRGWRDAWNNGLESRFHWCHFLVFVVGVGSTAFHGTLRHWGQALDEIPMIYTSLAMLYALSRDGKNVPFLQRRGKTLATVCFVYGLVFTVAYATLESFFIFFLLSYTVVITYLVWSGYCIFRDGDAAQRFLFRWSAGVYVGAVVLFWFPEILLCHKMPHLMQPLQLHAWWHVCSAIGSHNFIILLTYIRLLRTRKKPFLDYSPVSILPLCRRRTKE